MITTTELTRILDAAAAYGTYCADRDDDSDGLAVSDEFRLSIREVVGRLATARGWTVSTEYDCASSSTYLDVSKATPDDDGCDSFQIRISNHAMCYAGPLVSITTECTERGLRLAFAAIVERLDNPEF